MHDKFSATKSLFYCLVRLNVLILHSHKDTLLVSPHLVTIHPPHAHRLDLHHFHIMIFTRRYN